MTAVVIMWKRVCSFCALILLDCIVSHAVLSHDDVKENERNLGHLHNISVSLVQTNVRMLCKDELILTKLTSKHLTESARFYDRNKAYYYS